MSFKTPLDFVPQQYKLVTYLILAQSWCRIHGTKQKILPDCIL